MAWYFVKRRNNFAFTFYHFLLMCNFWCRRQAAESFAQSFIPRKCKTFVTIITCRSVLRLTEPSMKSLPRRKLKPVGLWNEIPVSVSCRNSVTSHSRLRKSSGLVLSCKNKFAFYCCVYNYFTDLETCIWLITTCDWQISWFKHFRIMDVVE
jgi:hypothetical protein